MANIDRARPEQRRVRTESQKRVIYGVLVGIMVLFGVGVVALNAIAWSQADESERAPACTSTVQVVDDADCVTWTTGKIVSFVNVGGKHAHHSLTVSSLPADSGFADTESISFQSGNALLSNDRIGTTVRVETWEGKQITVKAGSLSVETGDSPFIGRADLTAGSMLCFGLASFMMAMTFGVSGDVVVYQESFSASSLLTRRGRKPGAITAAVRIAVICWGVAATVAGFVIIINSLPVNAVFAVMISAAEALNLVALAFLAVRSGAQSRARKRAVRGVYA